MALIGLSGRVIARFESGAQANGTRLGIILAN
jgi:hypothetical protein